MTSTRLLVGIFFFFWTIIVNSVNLRNSINLISNSSSTAHSWCHANGKYCFTAWCWHPPPSERGKGRVFFSQSLCSVTQWLLRLVWQTLFERKLPHQSRRISCLQNHFSVISFYKATYKKRIPSFSYSLCVILLHRSCCCCKVYCEQTTTFGPIVWLYAELAPLQLL